MNKLTTILTNINDVDLMSRFLTDLLSERELIDINRRIEIATDIYKDRKYTDILEQHKTSSLVISKMKKALYYGQDGIADVLKQEEHNDNL